MSQSLALHPTSLNKRLALHPTCVNKNLTSHPKPQNPKTPSIIKNYYKNKIQFESKMEAFDLMFDEDELNNSNYCDNSPTQ